MALGGDTDTNCCIVGGLVGALVGRSKIDAKKVTKVLSCDTSLGTHKRADIFNPGRTDMDAMIDELLSCAPSELKVEHAPEEEM